MKVLHLGGEAGPLLGTFHAAHRLQARSAAVLLCNPFGEEAIRAHRIYRVLGTQLAAAGYPVLRFDYSSTGDSLGDGAAATGEAWLGEVGRAGDELRALGGARRLVAFGLRLGGTLAAMASARHGERLRHLLLWDPVVDGAAYLRELAGLHRAYMRAELGLRWPDRLRVSAEGFPAEALGAVITAPLAAQIAAIDLVSEELRADHVTVVSTRDAPGIDRLRDRLAHMPAARWITMPSSAAWNSDAALNAATVPMDIVRALVARVEEISP